MNRDEFNVPRDELDVTRDEFDMPRDEFDVTKYKFDVTRDEIDETMDELDVTRDEFDVTRDEFDDCIDAIDGTHVAACVPKENRVTYCDRNCEITQNVLAACSHQIIFTYVMIGWFLSDATRLELFLASYGEQHYVVDAGFLNTLGYVAP
ncbi:hypothetical protein CRG98_030081 [Punica granatum]|uniref:DDE Tnp4 domain-containing protein n=1 Tax=Punica granatum TaxID=22663 RepID=A0A2I0J000_PUNGR|nr:hypothetical protein CRG98_030081 [Punica granatum]